MSNESSRLFSELSSAFAPGDRRVPPVTFHGAGELPSVYPVTDLAAASIALAGSEIAALIEARHGVQPQVQVDRRLASFWFASSIRPLGWELPPAWDAVAGDYASADGWIRLHTNAPHHRAAALHVLGCEAVRADVESRVSAWRADDLETAVVEAGGCAATMRSTQDWSAHPQGRSVAREPLVDHVVGSVHPSDVAADRARPLAGLRVLDLTRVLAGPVATRFLAGFGAHVLRIDPPDWDEPGVCAEITLGKRCARLDLREDGDRDRLVHLLSQADVLVHGYRPGALERLGLSAEARQRIRPGLVDVALDAYGWTGPWQGRRGFDSLLQMSCGIAEAGMRVLGRDRPTPLPVQALDHATGYLLAAAVVRGLRARLGSGEGCRQAASLARTGHFLTAFEPVARPASLAPETMDDLAPEVEETSWGPARRLLPPLRVDQAPMRWDLPAGAFGTAAARFDQSFRI